MAKKTNKKPKRKSEDQERKFWSRNDSTDYIDWSKSRPIVLPDLKRTENQDILRLLAIGEKEIGSGNGYSLESVIKEADDLLSDDES